MQTFGASGGLLLGVTSSGCQSIRPKDLATVFTQQGVFEPNLFLRIHPDGQIVLAMNKSEMGQGIMTASATLAAEELRVPLEQVKAYQAYKAGFGMQLTGGSTSTATIFTPIRRAAATAREMLRSAAAEIWQVPMETCLAKQGAIHNLDTKEQLSYGELVEFASRQPISKKPPLTAKTEFTLVGTEGTRVDAYDKSTGKAIFGTDVSIDGKVCAYILRSPVMGAKALRVLATEALKQQGVLDIFAFERGVAVVAEKYWQAQRAAKMVKVEWGKGRTEGLNTRDLSQEARQRAKKKGDFTNKDIGNVEKVWEREDIQTLALDYEYPFLSHAPMEPQNCTALVDRERVTLWVPTQAPTVCVSLVQQLFDIPKENIEVNITMLGGGFGRRSCVDFVLEALQIAKRIPSIPVQVIWTREDDMTMGYYRPQGACRMQGAVDDAGNIVAIHSHLVSQLLFPDFGEQLDGAFPRLVPEKMRKKLAYAATGYLSGTSLMGFVEGGDIATCKYAIPNYRYDFTPIRTNVPVTAWRSVAHSYSTFMMETFIDQLAVIGNQDPASLRQKMLSDHPRYLKVIDTVLNNSRWGDPLEQGWGRGFAVSEFARSIIAQVVEAGIVEGQIVVRSVTCAVDCGLVINPDIVRAQVEGGVVYGLSMIYEKIELVEGVVQQRNFDTFPALRMHQMPLVNTIIVPSDNDPTGIGEIAVPPINAAVSNAIFAATGVRLTKMPLQEAWDEVQQQQATEKEA